MSKESTSAAPLARSIILLSRPTAGRRRLHLSFASKAVRSICESESTAVQELGPSAAACLRTRLADLDAAHSVADLPWDSGERHGYDFRVDLSDGYELGLRVNNLTPQLTSTGGVDWGKVDRVKVLWINRHDH
jgi:hypothetical protein